MRIVVSKVGGIKLVTIGSIGLSMTVTVVRRTLDWYRACQWQKRRTRLSSVSMCCLEKYFISVTDHLLCFSCSA